MFTEVQMERYSRHIILKEIGGKGQRNSSIFTGQTITALPGKSACYRCVFPVPPLPRIHDYLCPSRRHRHPAGSHRFHSGDRSREIPSRCRRIAERQASHLRRGRNGVHERSIRKNPDCGENPNIVGLKHERDTLNVCDMQVG